MKYTIKINKIFSIDEIQGTWTSNDYIELLNRFDFQDADSSDSAELRELLFMAITDFEPSEAAAIVLDYRLSEHLSEGQINNLSFEILEDDLSEEFADISLHHELFNINQLLYKAYNGKFPQSKATVIEFEIKHLAKKEIKITKEIVLKAFEANLTSRSVLKRLFPDQLAGKASFDEAEHIIWELKNTGQDSFTLITSDYWLSKDEIMDFEFENEVHDYEKEEND